MFEEKEENKLGTGGYGVVYRGTFEGNAVAVKLIVKVFKDHLDVERKKEQKREMEEHLRLDHENVLKLLHVDDSRDKTCLVLELCAGTLTDYCEKKYNGPELPPDGIVLYQIANGLHYIHSRNLVHRDVKPDNILISMTAPVQMKLSDLGFVKKINPRETFTQSEFKGTVYWMAPEILELVYDNITEFPHETIQSDTFAAGCVFFYFLTRGKHPFGISWEILANILSNNPKELNQHNKNLQGNDSAVYALIGKMIKQKEERISLPEVIKQLMIHLSASRKFKRVDRLVCKGVLGKCVARFHPTKLVIACGLKDQIIFFSAENSSISFSDWNEDENNFQFGHLEEITAMEWNADGTQLAAIFNKEVIMCWSYPSGEVLFQESKKYKRMNRIEWNPFRPNVFATFYPKSLSHGQVVFFFNSCPVYQRPFHFCTIDREKDITSFQWISENRVALGLIRGEGIKIWEIDESATSSQLVKRLCVPDTITDMAWDDRTKCLAACSWDGWMAILSMDSDQAIYATKVDGRCWRLAWRPNGKQTDDNFFLTGGLDKGQIGVWAPLENEKTRIFSQHSVWVNSLSFSPDGRFLASADTDRKLIIWTTENWEPVYIQKEENWGDRFSWSSSSTDVPDYKLTFDSYDGKVVAVEHIDGQCEIPSKD